MGCGLWFLSVGNVNLDVSVSLPSYPEFGRSIVVDDFWFGVGGAAINYSILVARFGYRVSLVSVISSMASKLGVLDYLRGLNVDTSFVRVVDGDPGFAIIILIPSESSRTIFSFRGVNSLLESSMVPGVGDHVHFASVKPSIVIGACDRLGGRLVSYDPGGEVYRDPGGVINTLECIDWLFLNEREARALNTSSLSDLLRGRVEMVIIKRGARGALLAGRSGLVLEESAPKVNVVDATGTGDAFDAAFNVTYLETMDPRKALELAIVAGALKATLRGSSNMPSKSDVMSLYEVIYGGRV